MNATFDAETHNRVDILSSIFSPRSIAVVGASDSVSKIGGIPIDYQKRFGYAGALYPVNPKSAQVQGLAAFASLTDIGAPVDLAIFAVPSHLTQAALEDAIAAKVRGVVMFTSGYAETGDQGALAQARLAATARAAGVRLLGPNCLGFINLAQNVYATFTPAPNAGRVQLGNIGLVSQSGAFGIYAYSLARARDIGISNLITTGNEADIDLADCIEWLAHDPSTHVIMVYMEGCRDGFKLRRALAAAHGARKPVVVVKVGRTDIGAAAAASHTAALAGNDSVYDTVFREYGVYRAKTIAEFFDIAASASLANLPRDRSVGLFTVSGGVGVLMADEAADAKLDIRPMSAASQELIRSWVPFAGPVNPVDITGQITNEPALIERTARLMLEDGQYSSWIGFMAAAGMSASFWPVIESLVINLRRDYPEKLLVLSSLFPPEKRRTIEALGCLVHSEPAEAVRAVAALTGFTEAFARPIGAPTPMGKVSLRLPPGVQSEPQAMATLAAAGISVAAHQVVHSAEAAIAAAGQLSGPVVLKIVSPDITHKSDIGGVALGLVGTDAIRDAFNVMQDAVRANAPLARIDGVLVAPMLSGGVECILGAHLDPVFGPMVMFGLGGVFVEIFGDVILHSAPVTPQQALEMIQSIKGFGLLSGARGREPVDIEFLASNLAALSRLAVAAGDSLDSIDINPFIALPKTSGGGCAADAVVVGRPATVA